VFELDTGVSRAVVSAVGKVAEFDDKELHEEIKKTIITKVIWLMDFIR
jgi:hypothetical protein